ncbi:MAG TPA: tRNA lysidine(34) synthetase TilS, partial [Gammaproteobacteria bacterium]|nr:tRNA lysidine(34) synthetase TilS [Gammaproteobacteria bacterium]
LRHSPPAHRYRVALSGGLDSSVLLHALAAERGALPGELSAVHVHHGLHPDADGWQARCERACLDLSVPLESVRVSVRPAKGESLEATARERRYAVFRDLMRPGDALLLAHHVDDQAETFLLQALRGAGVRGLAAMPERAELADGLLLRPLLRFTRADLETWARGRGLEWIEDPSNADRDFDRNYLRHEVMPSLKQRWPAAAHTLSRAARHSAEAEAVVQVLAAEDWQRYGAGETLPVQALEELPEPRARYLLRHWLHLRSLPMPPSTKLGEILLQARAAEDRNPCVDWEGVEVRRYAGHLYAFVPLPPAPEDFQLRPGPFEDLGPGLGALGLVPAAGEGIRAALCGPAGLRVSFRSGGETCRPMGRAHDRPLKKWLQEMHVFPWLRDRLPLVYSGEELLAVAGLFACEPHAARAGEAGLRIEWREHPPLH